ncbi:MAG: D-alanyl-D-alanine carboxypeptidase family protein [Verrucomicrobiota bacterium]
MILRFSRSIVIASLLAATALPASAATRKKKSTKHTDPSTQTDQAEQPVPLTPVEATSGGIPLTRAASVLVTDPRTARTLYEKNADERRPPASTQKLLTALLIAEAGNLDRRVMVQAIDTQAEPVKLYIKPGEIYSRRELLQVLLVHSTNDVARCLARDNAGSLEAFADKMNRKALELGMTHSNFVNPNGLPAPGQYSTARDMAKLARAAYLSPTIRSIVSMKSVSFTYADGRVREFKNTNRVLRGYPYCNGMKTGYTEAAGHCLISSGCNNGREVIVVVLGDNQQVWRDSYSLLAWGLSL